MTRIRPRRPEWVYRFVHNAQERDEAVLAAMQWMDEVHVGLLDDVSRNAFRAAHSCMRAAAKWTETKGAKP